jgi:lipid II:glycine glycyltransferase (peptidoglycan interpeptide bridge formation enzyme)
MLRVNGKYRVVENPGEAEWDDFVRREHGHVLQSSAWAELKSRFGWSVLRIVLVRGDAFAAGAQILFRKLPLGLVFAYVPRGPVANPQDGETLANLIDAVKDRARERGTFELKIEVNATTLDPPFPLTGGEFSKGLPIQPRTTIQVDLTRELDMILAQMKPKWRYNIRLAERKGVVVRAGSQDDVEAFYRLLELTGRRDRFAIHSLEYYRAAYKSFAARDAARLFVAEYECEPLAAIFVTAFGVQAIYLYGASGNAHRERMPNHALHWAAMQWAKARGCTQYDLWGIADTAWAEAPGEAGEQGDAAASLPHGLYQFKQGFGGEVVRYAGAYDVIFSRPRDWLYRRALALRRGAAGLG